MATVKAIDAHSIHQLQSGQVIIDLCSVVKELVENSLDATASTIEVRFKDYGLHAIEVQDDGDGIRVQDQESVALKHYTSKLSHFEDLASLNTYGFRGEALSSLSALSDLRITTTRAEDGSLGRQLSFAKSGHLESVSAVAARKGTTVAVTNIFYNLPVRRKELEKNIKREYNKVLGVLHAYGCIGTGIRMSVSNQLTKGKKTLLFATNRNDTVRDNIMNVFGTKALNGLIPLHLDLCMTSSLDGQRCVDSSQLRDKVTRADVQIRGHISRPYCGEGRHMADRQMFFVNSRPCALPQVSKVFNDVYKSFNLSQAPFIIANLQMDTGNYDVNISPDKRSILLHDQTALLDSLKAALVELFQRTDYVLPNSPAFTAPSTQSGTNRSSDKQLRVSLPRCADILDPDLQSSTKEADLSQVSSNITSRYATQNMVEDEDTNGLRQRRSILKQNFDSLAEHPGDWSTLKGSEISLHVQSMGHEDRSGLVIHDNRTSENMRMPRENSQDGDTEESEFDGQDGPSSPPMRAQVTVKSVSRTFDSLKTGKNALSILKDGSTGKPSTYKQASAYQKRQRVHEPLNLQTITRFAAPHIARNEEHESGQCDDLPRSASAISANTDCDDVLPPFLSNVGRRMASRRTSSISMSDQTNQPDVSDVEDDKFDPNSQSPNILSTSHAISPSQPNQDTMQPLDQSRTTMGKTVGPNTGMASLTPRTKLSTLGITKEIHVSINALRRLHQSLSNTTRAARTGEHGIGENHDGDRNASMPVLTSDVSTEAAEQKLSLVVHKEHFSHMKIIGQFNLGFVLAARPRADSGGAEELFIIDQHAADEKWNYERLQRTFRLEGQRLVSPKHLELTAVEEELVLHHKNALLSNGFQIEQKQSLLPGDDDRSDEPQSRNAYSLLTLPVSGGKTFDTADLEELLHLLSELPTDSSEIPRPQKVQKLLAMRACRSSIMIGKALTAHQMESVVRHLGEMDKPWNCPHGRPTMRHLASLKSWSTWTEGGEMSDSDWLRWVEGCRV